MLCVTWESTLRLVAGVDRTLAVTGAMLLGMWGVEVSGLSVTELESVRTQLASTSGILATGRCATVVLSTNRTWYYVATC